MFYKIIIMNQSTEQNPSFKNPICKDTYNSLPKIYGSGKPKKPLFRYQRNPTHRPAKHHCLSTLDIDKTERKKSPSPLAKSYGYKIIAMSQPKRESCSKKHCSCFKVHNKEEEGKLKNKSQSLTKRKVLLKPLLQRPDDLESHHKILRKSEPISQLPGGLFSNLQRNVLRWQQNPEAERRNNFPEESESSHQESYVRSKTEQISVINQLNNLEEALQSERIEHSHVVDTSERQKNFVTVEIQVNLSRDEIEEKTQNQEEDRIEEEPNFKEFGANTESVSAIAHQGRGEASSKIIPEKDAEDEESKSKEGQINVVKSRIREKKYKYKSRLRRAKYELESSDESEESNREKGLSESRALSSSSSVSLSSAVLKDMKIMNTQFHMLNQQENCGGGGSSRAKSVRTNGHFRVPDRSSYKSYLKNYKVLDQKSFRLKDLVKKPLFSIVEEEEGVFFGEYEDEKKNGAGISITELQIFQGTYQNDVKVKGCERNLDGVYKGYFLNGKREGYGTFQWNNGEIFQGNWQNGVKTGFGIWRSPKGDSYEGEWSNNRQNGSGRYKHKNSTYVGEFENFMKHGQGEEIFTNGDTYVGEYVNGKPQGKGKYVWYDGSVYEGDFEDGVRSGFGKLTEKTKNVYEGQFLNDFKHGQGEIRYPSGERFQGIFQEGIQVEGTVYHLDGRTELISK